MTIYEFLKKDHREVQKLFKKALKCLPNDPNEAKTYFIKIRDELTAHAKAEEEVFYNPLINRAEDEDTECTTREGTQEHHVVALLLKEIHQLDCRAPEWGAKLTVLSELVDHHVKEEEDEIFSKAREYFSREEAREIADQMVKLKAEYIKKVDSILDKEAEMLIRDKRIAA